MENIYKYKVNYADELNLIQHDIQTIYFKNDYEICIYFNIGKNTLSVLCSLSYAIDEEFDINDNCFSKIIVILHHIHHNNCLKFNCTSCIDLDELNGLYYNYTHYKTQKREMKYLEYNILRQISSYFIGDNSIRINLLY
jgi:hypothetical protein